ncbi:MAG TPA: hypothetical protein VF765_34825 [Polyangiaceae bacterium]
MSAWAAAVAVIAAAGGFQALPVRLFPLLAVAGVLLPTAAYVRAPGLRAWFDGFGQRRIVLLHAWRILAALTFWVYGARALLPPVFVRNAAWGDLVAGVLALAVVRWWPHRRGFLVFHAVGFADFLSAVGTGFSFALAGDPRMASIAAFPLALIPLFGVGLSGSSHLASFIQLSNPNRTEKKS